MSAYAATARASTARWSWRPRASTAPTATGRAGPWWRWRDGCPGSRASTAAPWSWSCRARTRAGSGAELQAVVSEVGGTATVGVAATSDALAGDRLVAAHGEARRCLDTLLRLGRAGEVSDPTGLGVARLLLGDNDPEHVAAFVEAMVGPVRAWDARRGTGLVATLEAWFASGGHLRETAAELHVHPNTVTQRLDRVGELLGPGWRDPARGLDLQLALRLARLQQG